MAAARSPGPDLLPVLLLAGLAVWLLTRTRTAAANTQATVGAQLAAARDAARYSAIGQAAAGLFAWLGNPAPTNGTPTPAALDQIVNAAEVWQKTYGEAAGEDGDPYGEW